jgi:hypothetical protein
VDDRVRGGSSTSSLLVSASGRTAVFRGELDTRTLGGAGFASQCTVEECSWDLGGWEGLEVDVGWGEGEEGEGEGEKEEGKRFVLLVKDERNGKRMDGRSVSGVTWEWEFTTEGTREGERLRARWEEFRPVYRGKEIPMPDGGLKKREIKRIGFMMRRYVRFIYSPFSSLHPSSYSTPPSPNPPPSPLPPPSSPSTPNLPSFFNAQSGPFTLPLRSLAAIKLRGPHPAQPPHTGDCPATPPPASLEAEKLHRQMETERASVIGALTAEMLERGDGTGAWKGYEDFIGRT